MLEMLEMDLLDHPDSGYEPVAQFISHTEPSFEAEPGNPATRVPAQRSVTLTGLFVNSQDEHDKVLAANLPPTFVKIIESYIAKHYNDGEETSQG